MTQPRLLKPGHTFEVNRRVRDRRLALLPNRQTNRLVLYCLAYAASETSIELHSLVVMGSHYHMKGTDPLGELPKMMALFNVLIAKALNELEGREGRFWSGRPYGHLTIVHPADYLRRSDYCAANPLEENMVARMDDYPGLWIRPEDIGRELQARKPCWFFSAEMPEVLPIVFVPPPQFAHLPLAEYRILMRDRVTALERLHDERRRREGVTVIGAKRLAARHDRNRVATKPEKRGRLNPRVVGANGRWKAKAAELKRFYGWHEMALRAWQAGVRDVVFPYGTYEMARLHGALVEPWPGAAWHVGIKEAPRAGP